MKRNEIREATREMWSRRRTRFLVGATLVLAVGITAACGGDDAGVGGDALALDRPAASSEGSVTSWVDVDPTFPDEPLTLAGPGTDSGTFDYFTETVNGEGGASRADYTASEDDNVIVQAVEGARGGTGYFGFSYFAVNPDALKALSIDGGDGCVEPSIETALSGEYAPLARPLFVYASAESLRDPVVREFMRFYLENARELAETALFVPLSSEQQAQARELLEEAAG